MVGLNALDSMSKFSEGCSNQGEALDFFLIFDF